MLYNLHFFSSKCRLFHNATLFGFCITHILNTGCAKIWKRTRRQKVNSEAPSPSQTTNPVSYLKSTETLSRWIKRQKLKADHSRSSSVKVKISWSYTSNILHFFIVRCLISYFLYIKWAKERIRERKERGNEERGNRKMEGGGHGEGGNIVQYQLSIIQLNWLEFSLQIHCERYKDICKPCITEILLYCKIMGRVLRAWQ